MSQKVAKSEVTSDVKRKKQASVSGNVKPPKTKSASQTEPDESKKKPNNSVKPPSAKRDSVEIDTDAVLPLNSQDIEPPSDADLQDTVLRRASSKKVLKKETSGRSIKSVKKEEKPPTLAEKKKAAAKKKKGVGGKSRSKARVQVNIFSEAAMQNAFYICHNIQDLLAIRGFPWPDAQKKKKGKK